MGMNEKLNKKSFTQLTVYRLSCVEQEQPAVVAGGGDNAVVEWINAETANCPLMLQHL